VLLDLNIHLIIDFPRTRLCHYNLSQPRLTSLLVSLSLFLIHSLNGLPDQTLGVGKLNQFPDP